MATSENREDKGAAIISNSMDLSVSGQHEEGVVASRTEKSIPADTETICLDVTMKILRRDLKSSSSGRDPKSFSSTRLQGYLDSSSGTAVITSYLHRSTPA